jgi:hypothetical protein
MGSSTDPLRAFLWGKRRAIRHPVALGVEVQGSQRPVTGLSLDVSAGGAMLRFDLDDLMPSAADEVDPFLLAQTHFRGPRLARFRRHRLKVHLELVRLDYRPDAPDHLFVGVRFARPLSEKQLRKLGLDPTLCGPESHGLPSELVELRAVDDPVVCRIYNLGDAQHPMFEGLLLGRGDGTLCVRLDDTDLGVVGKRLRDDAVRIEVLDGDQPDWEAQARLQAIGLLNHPPGALELGLVVHESKAPSRRKQAVPKRARRKLSA